jgi:hypothetical protein
LISIINNTITFYCIFLVNIPSLIWNATGITVGGSNAGLAGTAAALLNYPYGVALDSSKSLYIADHRNNRIQQWLANASYGITVAGLPNGTAGASLVALNEPVAIVFDSSDNMYFTDRNNARVVFWPKGASSGTTVAGITVKTDGKCYFRTSNSCYLIRRGTRDDCRK